MARGLFWLPLLIIFIWLAWAGWNEFQKVEAYRTWAQQFERAKYDLYAVLGQQGDTLTWGKPTRKGPIELQTFSLKQVQSIQVMMADRPVDPDNPPSGNRDVALAFQLPDTTIRIPFTELSLAMQWGKFLQERMRDEG